MKKWTEVSAGDINAANQRLWAEIGDNAEDTARRINTDPVFVAKVARFMANGGCESSTLQKLAREIMGKNFFGIEDAIKYLGIKPTKQQLACLNVVPWGDDVLEFCKDTHILVAVFPLSILDIRTHVYEQFIQTIFFSQDWYDKQVFAKIKSQVGWHLIRKRPVANSTSEIWNFQQNLLSRNEKTPNARIMVYAMVGHFIVAKERILENVYVRCDDVCSDGGRVEVGSFDVEGLAIRSGDDGVCESHVGLAAARK